MPFITVMMEEDHFQAKCITKKILNGMADG
jgi:hypothetical protein